MLTVIEKVVFLQDINELAEVPTEQLSHIASITEEVELDAGAVLIRQDEPAEAFYLVIEGSLRLDHDGREIMIAREKDPIGVWSLFDSEQPNIATATALELTRLLKIEREAFFDIVADYVEITQGILKSLVRRVRRVGQQVFEESGKDGTN